MTARLHPMLVAALAVACGCGMDALMKHLAEGAPLLALIGWRYVLGSALSASLMRARRRPMPDAEGLRFHAVRGLVAAGGGLCFFYALTQLALSHATVLIFAAALMIAPIARVLLAERISRIGMLATLAGFAGVAFASLAPARGAPEGGDPVLGAIAALAAACFYALGVVMLRMRAGREDELTIVTFSNVVPALVFLPFVLTTPVDPYIRSAPLIALAATLGVGIWWLMSAAYARAPAQQLAPVEYTALIWATLLGWIAFGERPTLTLLAGAAIIIASCLAVAFDTHFAARREARVPASDLLH